MSWKDVSDGFVEAVPNDSRLPAGVSAGVACEEAEAWAGKVPGALSVHSRQRERLKQERAHYPADVAP